MLQEKLSIPATVSRMVKYIPELQQQVDVLIQKKEELIYQGFVGKVNKFIKKIRDKLQVGALYLLFRQVGLMIEKL